MNILATILIFIFVPFNYYLAGIFFSEKTMPDAESKVEGAFDSRENENQPVGNSFKGSLSDSQPQEENFGGLGYLPQRKKSYYDTKISASSSVVIDVDSGTILYYKEGRLQTSIASLTKLMTAIVVMENVKNLDEEVIISQEETLVDGTKVGCPSSVYCVDERLHKGEKITVKSLLMAMLLNSANDAAVALGDHVAGSQKEFAKLMNKKAENLNLSDSKFCNPSGLDEENCHSSAYDLARITAYSMKYDLIWKIFKLPEAEIESSDGKYIHHLKNTDLLLGQIPNCLGGKTGFTYNAGKSLMMAAADPQTGAHKIIAVVLNDDDRWDDMAKLINWTFENYEWK